MTKEQAIEQLKDLKAVYSGAVQAGEISIANMIKGGIDLIEKLQKENEELKFKERRRIIGKYGEFEIHDVINRTLSNDYIPVQKVKEKIEELKEDKDSKYYYIFLEERDIENTIKILQELLDNRK